MQNTETPPCKGQDLFKAKVLRQTAGLEQTIFAHAEEVTNVRKKTTLLRRLVSISRQLKSLVS